MSFTRYNKVGRESQKRFESALQKDGFHHLHSNLYVRYCTTSSNANMHKDRVKGFIPDSNSDISIIMSADNQEQNTYHSLNRKRTKSRSYKKPEMVEFF